MQLHLKGGPGVQVVRWSFVAVCFMLFVFSVSVLTISAVNYAEMRVAFDEVGSRTKYDFNPNYIFHHFKPEAALGIFYFGMTIGTVSSLISCIGSCGAAFLDRCFLTVFVMSLGIVLFGTIITLSVVAYVFREDLQLMAEQLYKGFIEHFYGRPDLMLSIMTRVIDTVQSTQRCCGVLKEMSPEETKKDLGTWPAHYTALYWLESTQWGQIQANDIGYEENGTLKWVPDSCCKVQSANCSLEKFGARLDEWNEDKEKAWNTRIHSVDCGPYLLNFSHLEATDRTKVIAIAIFVMVLLLATIVLACWLCQAISAYEFSSKESELDQRRHHRRRRYRGRRKHRKRLIEKGIPPPPTAVVVEPPPKAESMNESSLTKKSQMAPPKEVQSLVPIPAASGKTPSAVGAPGKTASVLGSPAKTAQPVKTPATPKSAEAKVEKHLVSPASPVKAPGLSDK